MIRRWLERRGFLEMTGVSALVALGGSSLSPLLDEDGQDFDVYAVLVGPSTNRPPPDGQYLRKFHSYRFVYWATDTGQKSVKTHLDDDWTTPPEFLKHVDTDDFPVGGEGTTFWDSDRKTVAWYDGDDVEHPIMGNDVLLTTQEVVNTTTKTQVFSADIDAGSMKTGRVYEVVLSGAYSTVNSSDTFDLEFRVGNTTVTTLTSVADQVTDAPISMRLVLTVRSEGASGSIVTQVHSTFNNTPNDDANPTPITIDTTAVTSWSVHIQWSSADAANSVKIVQGHMKEVS